MDEKHPIEKEWLERMEKQRSDFLVRLFSVFMQNEPERVEKIRKAVEDGNMEELQFLSHSLKGAAATMGAERVRSCSLDLENAAKEQDLERSVALLERLEHEMDRTYAFMEEYVTASARTS